MNSLNTTQLFEVWENAMDKPPLYGSLLLLAYACDERMPVIEKMSIGERDARLLMLREWMFGKRMFHLSHCPHCGEKIEWETDTSSMRIQDFNEQTIQEVFRMDYEGRDILFRLPNSRDMIRTMRSPNSPIKHLRIDLLRSCILKVNCQDPSSPNTKINESILDELESRFSIIDPQADIQMNLSCPSCNHNWVAAFDIVSWLWSEIENWAHHIMQEVYYLARHFGWTEKDILAMSPRRRQLYLQMVQA